MANYISHRPLFVLDHPSQDMRSDDGRFLCVVVAKGTEVVRTPEAEMDCNTSISVIAASI